LNSSISSDWHTSSKKHITLFDKRLRGRLQFVRTGIRCMNRAQWEYPAVSTEVPFAIPPRVVNSLTLGMPVMVQFYADFGTSWMCPVVSN
jgi:hypothetical protein